MTDEKPAVDLDRAQTDAVPITRNGGDAEGNRENATHGDDHGASYAVATSEESTADGEARREEMQRRRLFAEAQEHFAAGDFVGSHRCLKQIPAASRTADVERLLKLVMQRVREVADLRSEIETAWRRGKTADVQEKLLRYLELQPGDEWANDLRHRLEVDEQPAAPPILFDDDSGETDVSRRRNHTSKRRPSENRQKRKRPPPVSQAMEAEILEDDQTVEQEIWEFGERLVSSRPPPLPGQTTTDDDLNDEFEEWTEGSNSSTGVWIAFAVSGMVILLAVIATVLVLVMETAS